MSMPLELHGSITQEEKTFIETWENVAPSVNYIIMENRRGDEVQTPINGRRTFRLSTYERMITEEKCLDPRNNPFKNGAFRPVTVPTGITVETNPNALSDDDINRLFVASDVAWDEYMLVIDSPATLQRMLEMAENSGLSLKRYRQLERMHVNNTNIGKRIEHSDPDIQAQIDSIGGQSSPAAVRRAGGTGNNVRATSSTQRG